MCVSKREKTVVKTVGLCPTTPQGVSPLIHLRRSIRSCGERKINILEKNTACEGERSKTVGLCPTPYKGAQPP